MRPQENDPLLVFSHPGGITTPIKSLMYRDSAGVVRNASQLADQGTEIANQNYFAQRFAGVGLSGKTSANAASTDFVVAEEAVAYVDCASSTFQIGDLVAIAENGDGDGLENSKVVKTTNGGLAIGEVVQQELVATTKVKVRFKSRFTQPAPGAVVLHKLTSQVLDYDDFTDNTNTTGYIDVTPQLPAGAIVTGWEANVITGFTGDTTAVMQVGVSGTLAAFSANTAQSVLAAGRVGSASLAASSRVNTATTIRVTVTGGADFTSISAGSMVLTVYYFVPTL